MTMIKPNASKGKKTKRQEENIYDITFTFQYGNPFKLYSISEAATEGIMTDMLEDKISTITYEFSNGDEVVLLKNQMVRVETKSTARII